MLNSSYPQDESLMQKLAPYNAKLEEYRKATVAQTATALDGSSKSCRLVECNLGSIFSDAAVEFYIRKTKPKNQTHWAAVALGIMNGGGVRDFVSTPQYNVTLEDLYTAFPFANTVEMVELP